MVIIMKEAGVITKNVAKVLDTTSADQFTRVNGLKDFNMVLELKLGKTIQKKGVLMSANTTSE